MIADVKRFWGEKENKRNIAIILWAYLLLNWLVYIPFVFQWGSYGALDFKHSDTSVFMRYWDGPFYAGIAKTMYNPENPFYETFQFSNPEYFTNHFPLFPLLIRVGSFFMSFESSLLIVNQIFAVVGVVLLYYFFTLLIKPREAVVLSLVQLGFPYISPLLRNVGNSEVVFFFLIIIVMIGIVKNKWSLAIAAACFAALTRPVGVLLAPGIALAWWFSESRKWKEIIAVVLVPIATVGVYLYQLAVVPGLNLASRDAGFQQLIAPPPLSVFYLLNYGAGSVLYLLFACIVGFVVLYKMSKTSTVYKKVFWVCLTSLSYLLFVIHHDDSRFIWPFFPFIVLLPLKDVFMKKEVQIALLLLIPAVLLSVWGMLVINQMPENLFLYWLDALHL